MMKKKKEKTCLKREKKEKNPKHNLSEESISQWVRNQES